eukprot:GEMP01011923.1.p1 GENE.GEMP01011923.1~~GEMP01011923.1.p1  ORF type:complete len:770 (+),score=180.31 GEMP01011923.1:87-2396(+)
MSRGDSLISANQTTALVLATTGDDTDKALATLDELGLKRKSRWSEMNIPKKGRRWGLTDDIPYKPLSYIDLPVGMSEKEVDQFLREQRLEDLIKKVKNNELEDCDPDIRPPSPPPIYDKNGSRLNTREVRIRKSMHAELNRLVRYMLKSVKGYVPPPGWKPQKLAKKFIIPIDKYPTAPFMGVIIGPRGVNHKKLQEETRCRIVIRGKDITDKWQSEEEMNMPQHVHVEADTEEQIEYAERVIKPLLNPESEAFELARNAGMEQLAMVNGFTIIKSEQRCGICGAMGHMGFECPETNFVDYKMADVTCSICGDKGHVTMDCPENLRKQQEENRDWKAEAEKKREMEASYAEMMSELGMGNARRPGDKTETGYSGPIGSRVDGVQDGPNDLDYNKDMSIPGNFAGKFIGPQGSNIKGMSSNTGCHITLEPELGSNSSRFVIIRGPPEKREVGKKAVENWIRAHKAGHAPSSGSGHRDRDRKPNASWKFGSTVSDITFGGGSSVPKSSPQPNRQLNRPGISSAISAPPGGGGLPPGVRVLGRDPPRPQLRPAGSPLLANNYSNFNNQGNQRFESRGNADRGGPPPFNQPRTMGNVGGPSMQPPAGFRPEVPRFDNARIDPRFQSQNDGRNRFHSQDERDRNHHRFQAPDRPGRRDDRFQPQDRGVPHDDRFLPQDRGARHDDRFQPQDDRIQFQSHSGAGGGFNPGQMNNGHGMGPGNPTMGGNSNPSAGGYQGPNIRAVPLNAMQNSAVPKTGMQQQLPTAKWTPGGMAP